MTGAEGRARTIDVDGTFAGEGEDMIAALIAASANPATRGGAGRGEGTTRGFEKDGDVVKAKRSFERELVPFDFEDGTSAVDAVVRETNVEVEAKPRERKTTAVPTPKVRGNEEPTKAKTKERRPKPKAVPAPKTVGLIDPRVRANQVCEPQQPALTPEQQAAVLAADGSGKKSKGKVKTATNDERWAQASFQNAPAADQLPMPSFLKDIAPTNSPRVASSSAPPRLDVATPRPQASAAGLKNLLGVKPAAAPQQAKGHALFNNILNSANGDAHPSPPPMMAPSHYAAPPPPQGVQQKLNTLFGVQPQPAQPFPVAPPYPTAPETSGGSFQTLMAKLNAGRV